MRAHAIQLLQKEFSISCEGATRVLDSEGDLGKDVTIEGRLQRLRTLEHLRSSVHAIEGGMSRVLNQIYQYYSSIPNIGNSDILAILSVLTPCLASRRRSLALRACACIADVGVRLQQQVGEDRGAWQLFLSWLLGSGTPQGSSAIEQQGLGALLCCYSIHRTLGRTDCMRLLMWGCSNISNGDIFRAFFLPVLAAGGERISPADPGTTPGLRELELATLFAQVLRSVCDHAVTALNSLIESSGESRPPDIGSYICLAEVLLTSSRGTVEHGALALLQTIRRRDTWAALQRAIKGTAESITAVSQSKASHERWKRSAICQSSERSVALVELADWMLEAGSPHGAETSNNGNKALEEAYVAICGWRQHGDAPRSVLAAARARAAQSLVKLLQESGVTGVARADAPVLLSKAMSAARRSISALSLYRGGPDTALAVLLEAANRFWVRSASPSDDLLLAVPYVSALESMSVVGRARHWPHLDSPLSSSDLRVLSYVSLASHSPRGLLARTVWLTAIGTYRASHIGHGCAKCAVPALLRIMALDLGFKSPRFAAAIHGGAKFLLARAKQLRFGGVSVATTVYAVGDVTSDRRLLPTLGALRYRARGSCVRHGRATKGQYRAHSTYLRGRDETPTPTEGLVRSLCRQFFASYLSYKLGIRVRRYARYTGGESLGEYRVSDDGVQRTGDGVSAVEQVRRTGADSSRVIPPYVPPRSTYSGNARHSMQSRPSAGGRGLLRDMLAAARQRRRQSAGGQGGGGSSFRAGGHLAIKTPAKGRASHTPKVEYPPHVVAVSAGDLLDFLTPPPKKRDMAHVEGGLAATLGGFEQRYGRPSICQSSVRVSAWDQYRAKQKYHGSKQQFLLRRSGRLASDSVRSSFDRSSGKCKRATSHPSDSSFSTAEVLLAGSSDGMASQDREDTHRVLTPNPPQWAIDILRDCTAVPAHADAKGKRSFIYDYYMQQSASGNDGVVLETLCVLLAVGGPIVSQGIREAMITISRAVRPVVEEILRESQGKDVAKQAENASGSMSASAASFSAIASLPSWVREVASLCGVPWTEVIGAAIADTGGLQAARGAGAGIRMCGANSEVGGEGRAASCRRCSRPDHGSIKVARRYRESAIDEPYSCGLYPASAPEGPIHIVGQSPRTSAEMRQAGSEFLATHSARSARSVAPGLHSTVTAQNSSQYHPRVEITSVRTSPIRQSTQQEEVLQQTASQADAQPRPGAVTSTSSLVVAGVAPPKPPSWLTNPTMRPGRKIRVSQWQPFARKASTPQAPATLMAGGISGRG